MAERATPATPAAAAPAEDAGCWQQKAVCVRYDQCFDRWYKDVFLQQKAHGTVGCQDENKAYSQCFLKELEQDAPLVEGIKSAMTPDIRARWDDQAQKRKE